MARGVNKVILVGNLGSKPELRKIRDDLSVANVSLAVTERFTSGGEKQDRTEWFRLTFWRQLADIADRYLDKGSQVYVEGRMRQGKWTDADGNERISFEVEVDQLLMLSGNATQGNGARQQESAPAAEEDEEIDFDV